MTTYLIQPSIACRGHRCDSCKTWIFAASPIFKMMTQHGEDYWCLPCVSVWEMNELEAAR